MRFELAQVDKIHDSAVPWADRGLLLCMGDFHSDDKACAIERVKRDVDRALEYEVKTGNWVRFLNMGDNVDVMSPSNRRNLASIKLYDSVYDVFEEACARAVEKLEGILAPTVGKWAGMVQGHHYYEFSDGTTSDTRLAHFLKAPFLGDCGIVRLKFKDDAGRTRGEHEIWCHHGTGGGKLPGSPVNILYHVSAAFDADSFVIGHQHKLFTAPYDRVYITRKRPYRARHRKIQLGAAGGYLRAYMLDSKRGSRAQGGYVEKAAFNPTTMGALKMWFECFQENGDRVIERTMEV